MKIDLSQSLSAASSSDPHLLDAADFTEHVLREQGVSERDIELAMRGENFYHPHFGKCRIKAWQGGRGGSQDGKAGWRDSIHLYAIVKGISYAEACRELRKIGQPVQSIRPRSRPAITTERDEEQVWRFSGDPATEWGLGLACLKNKPITPAACIAHGAIDGKFQQYDDRGRIQRAIGFPAYSYLSFDLVTYQMICAGGFKLTLRKQDPATGQWGSIEYKVVSSERGISESIMTSAESMDWLRAGKVIPGLIGVKCEGPKDMLALWSIAQQATRPVLVFTNTAGCRTHYSVDPMIERLKGLGCEQVIVVHDCDQPGQEGALAWVDAARKSIGNARNLLLPFPITEKRGKDLRDWASERPRTWDDFIALPDVGQGGAA